MWVFGGAMINVDPSSRWSCFNDLHLGVLQIQPERARNPMELLAGTCSLATVSCSRRFIFPTVISERAPNELRHTFDTVQEQWTQVMPEDLPSARHGHSAILDTDRMWIFGGAGGNNGLNPSEDLLYYLDLSDLSDLRWIRVSTNTPSARFEHTAVVESGKMWIFGGHSGQRPSGALNDLHYLDLEAGRTH